MRPLFPAGFSGAAAVVVCILLLTPIAAADPVPFQGPIKVCAGTFPEGRDSITVLYPNGGQLFYTGELQGIEWEWTGPIDTVKIQYSIDEGETWALVTGSTWNHGFYWWTVPDTPSEHCIVRVSDGAIYSVSDVSDDEFSIAPPCFLGTALTAGARTPG